jgi:phosphoglycerate dehydrogenase-like enzyme
MNNRVIYLGSVEADSAAFEARARADFPGIDLLATNDRVTALCQINTAAAVIAHHYQFDNDILQRGQQLRWIQSLTTGTDAILKLPALRPEIVLTSTRGMHGPQMSELVFMQMLALLRDFPRVIRNQAAQRWERWPQPLLFGKTIVIVGVGAISEQLAPRCKAFGMSVYGVSSATRVPPAFDGIFGRDELRQAAARADFLVLIVPHSPKTENLIDAQVLAAMKSSAYLINVARGGVLDEDALIRALEERRIAGAALDVFREQPLPPNSRLWNMARVLVTPLIGGMSDIYLEQAYGVLKFNLAQFLFGATCAMRNVVPH